MIDGYNHRIRATIHDPFTETAAEHIKKGDLTRYEVEEKIIFKYLTDEEYNHAVQEGENEPFIMSELGIEAEYDYNFRK